MTYRISRRNTVVPLEKVTTILFIVFAAGEIILFYGYPDLRWTSGPRTAVRWLGVSALFLVIVSRHYETRRSASKGLHIAVGIGTVILAGLFILMEITFRFPSLSRMIYSTLGI
jgi:hypothetical protein